MLRWVGHQRWIRYGLRERLLRALRHPEHCGTAAFEVPFAGYAYPGRKNRWIDWIVYYYGAYEQDELETMRSLVAGRPAVALDIGANVGHHSLYMASFCAQVHAFEPYEKVACAIDNKIRRNGLRHVHVHRVGLSDQERVLDFYAPQGVNTGTGSFVATHEVQNNCLVGQLRVVKADDYIASLQLQRIDLVKIDVEGFELSVLRGLPETLRRHRPIVMLELSDEARQSLPSMAALMALFPPGYRAEVVHSRQARWMLFGRTGCALHPLQWHHRPLPGGYVNLLLRPGA
jgi:FkbM family methyltransferase